MDDFEKDLARVKEIATFRVEMFDSGRFSDPRCAELFQEYMALRRKWGFNSDQSLRLKAASGKIWDE